jgi:GNAT superfamily N-acetyltransferase
VSLAQLRGLMESAYGSAPAESELDWWLNRNPLGSQLLVDAAKGADGMSLFRVAVAGQERVAGFIVHAVTAPDARGNGVFSRLQRTNEEWAASQGATLAFGFTTAMATRVLVGKLGWELLARPRVWVRVHVHAGTGLRGAEIDGFDERQEQRRLDGPAHLLKDARWLDWRYRESPRPYRLVKSYTNDDYAVVGIGRHRGFTAGAICEHVGGRGPLRRAIQEIDAPVIFALPGRRKALYASTGFVPTPWRLNFVGRRLVLDAPLPRDWRLSLGDTDFF